MISLVVAYSRNRVIGNKGQIPWKIKGEQKRFKDLTTGNTVIMGRKSYEEIGHPLPNRQTIVISSTMKTTAENCIVAASLSEAIKCSSGQDIFISGGAGLYREAIALVDKMFVTLIEAEFDGDTYFPEFDETEWDYEENQYIQGNIPYKYVTYTRKR